MVPSALERSEHCVLRHCQMSIYRVVLITEDVSFDRFRGVALHDLIDHVTLLPYNQVSFWYLTKNH